MEESSKYGEAGKVNMLAYRVKNTNENEKFINDGIVVSDFVATKRMVVEQDDAMIGITIKDGNLNDQVTTFTDLTHMYAEELNAAQRNNYIASNINVPVIANVLYTDQPVIMLLNSIRIPTFLQKTDNTDWKILASKILLSNLKMFIILRLK